MIEYIYMCTRNITYFIRRYRMVPREPANAAAAVAFSIKGGDGEY